VTEDADEPSTQDTLSAPGGSTSGHRTLRLLSSSARPLRSLADLSAVATNPGVLAEVHGRTDIGQVRDANQDQFLIAALERSLLIEGSSLPAEAGTRLTDTPQGRLLIVADGIGGHGGGEVASAVAIDAMAHYAFETMPWVMRGSQCSTEALAEGLNGALRNAQARIRRVARRKGLNEDLGTTFTMAYVAWPDLYVCHVGDSRAYLLRDGALHRVTKDHTLAQQLVDGAAMSEEDARGSRFSHVLVNAVGGRSDDLDVELHKLELQLDDQLLLCSDGLYDMVSDDAISEVLRNVSRPVQQAVDELVDAANAAGGRDNITVVLARF
jgi:serine/threonine protein phosphatase PrpC